MQMEWIKCSEKLPDKSGPIAVLIGNEIFLGKSVIAPQGWYIDVGYEVSGKIDFHIARITEVGDIKITSSGNEWVKPSYIKDPDYWTYLPETPKD